MKAHLRARRLVFVSVPVLAACLFGSATVSAQDGLKETEQFIKAGGNLSQAVAAAKLQVQSTLANYNDLLSKSATEMKSSYKKLIKNIKLMTEKTDEAATRVSEMQTVGDAYFAGRAATVKKIQDPALQAQAQGRLEESQRAFSSVLASLREARESFDPLRKDLADHVKYLESDLSPSGTASLKPQADEAKANAAVLFGKADDAIRAANNYFTGLRAR